MFQPKISSFIKKLTVRGEINEKTVNDGTIKIAKDEILKNFKQEPSVEFLVLLPAYQPNRRLLGNVEVKTEINDDSEKSELNENKKGKRKKCPICQKLLLPQSYNSHLKLHEMRNDEPKFQCEICLKKFFGKANLTGHMVIHEPQHKCKLCCQKFLRKQSYVDHLLLHEDPDAFKCDICLKLHGGKSVLLKHLLSDHKHEIYRCRHCKKNHKFNKNICNSVTKRKCPCKLGQL